MESYNRVIMIGQVNVNPEFRMTRSGKKICRFPILLTDLVKKNNGEYRERRESYNIVAVEKMVDFVKKNIIKGIYVFVEGKLYIKQWTVEGDKKIRVDINAIKIIITENIIMPQNCYYISK